MLSWHNSSHAVRLDSVNDELLRLLITSSTVHRLPEVALPLGLFPSNVPGTGLSVVFLAAAPATIRRLDLENHFCIFFVVALKAFDHFPNPTVSVAVSDSLLAFPMLVLDCWNSLSLGLVDPGPWFPGFGSNDPEIPALPSSPCVDR